MKKATDGLTGAALDGAFPVSTDGLADAFDFLAQSVETLGLDETVAQRLSVIVDEMGSNLIRHDPTMTAGDVIRLSLRPVDQGVELRITDPGQPFDPVSFRLPGTPEIGGRGLALIRGLAVSVEYQRLAGANHLTVVLAPETRI
ncbi:MAG: ATP-binding protein [Pseudomonadota bacterium]